MFQTALIESGANGFRVPRLPLGVALALHGGAVVLVVAGIAFRTDDGIPEPSFPIRLVVAAVPPSPGGGGPERRIPSRAAAGSAPRHAFIPSELRPAVPDAETRLEGVETTGRELDEASGTAPAGEVGEVDGVGPGGRQANEGTGAPIHEPGGDVRAPLLLLRVDPTYPEAARRARAAGTVVLEAIISAAGVVEEVRVVKSVHPLLDAEAARALESWRYRAATLNGRAVRVRLTVTVTFGLH